MNISSANIDQIAFIAYLLIGHYDKKYFIEKAKVSKKEVFKKESSFSQIKAFNMAKMIYNNSKRNLLKSTKSLFTKNFKEGTTKEQRAVLLDAIKLYDGRSKIIRLFENKNIKPSNYPHNAKFEPDEHNIEEKSEKKYDGGKKSEQKSLKSIGERRKLRKQKSNEFNKMLTEKNEIINRQLFKNYFHQFESLSDMENKLSKTQNAQTK